MTTILIKKKDTAGAPAPGDLTNAAGGTEIAVNTATKRIYTKDSGGNVVELGTNATSSTIVDLTVTTSTTLSYGTANQVQYLNGSKLLVGSANMTFNGTTLTVAGFSNTGNEIIGTNTSNTLVVNSLVNSSLLFTDNTYDIGASLANRPRNLYVGTAATIGNGLTVGGFASVNLGATTSALQVRGFTAGSGNFILQDNVSSGNAWWLSAKTSSILAIGGNGTNEPSQGAINIGTTGNVSIGTTGVNGKLTTYGGTAGGTATTLTPIETAWLEYAAAIGDNRGSGPSYVFSSSNAPSNLGKSAAIGAPSEDSGGLSRTVGLSFWTSGFDANRAEVGRFTGNGGNFLVGKTAGYGVSETNTIQAKGSIVWAADNTASANNRNWLVAANASANGSWDLVNSSSNTAWPNNAYILSITRDGQANLNYGDMVIGGTSSVTSRMYRAIEVGTAGNNAGFSCGGSGSKGSIWGASGASGLYIVGGNPGQINFGYSTGDSSLYANYSSLGVWNLNGLGIGTTNPTVILDVVKAGNVYLRLNNTTYASGSADQAGVQLWSNNTYRSALYFNDTAGGTVLDTTVGSNQVLTLKSGSTLSLTTTTSNIIQFVTNNSERARIPGGGGWHVGATGGNPSGSFAIIQQSYSSGKNGLMMTNGDGGGAPNYVAFQGYDWVRGAIWHDRSSGFPLQIAINPNTSDLTAGGLAPVVTFTNSGEMYQGTTSGNGSMSNDKGFVTGRVRTIYGQFIPPSNGTWNTIATIGSEGLYVVHAYIGGYNAGPGDWSNAWFITYTGGNNAYVSPSVFGSTGNIQCRIVAPTTIQIFASAGAGITYTYIILRIS
jgi:hypothetical protein